VAAPAKTRRAATEVLIRADDQLWQLMRLARKAEAFDQLVDIERELASIDEKLKQTLRSSPGKAGVMENHLQAERIAVVNMKKRLLERLR
jgi:hypothetical protein